GVDHLADGDLRVPGILAEALGIGVRNVIRESVYIALMLLGRHLAPDAAGGELRALGQVAAALAALAPARRPAPAAGGRPRPRPEAAHRRLDMRPRLLGRQRPSRRCAERCQHKRRAGDTTRQKAASVRLHPETPSCRSWPTGSQRAGARDPSVRRAYRGPLSVTEAAGPECRRHAMLMGTPAASAD